MAGSSDNLTNSELAVNALRTEFGAAPISFRPISPTLPMPQPPIAKPVKGLPIVATTAKDPSGQNGVPKKLLAINVVQAPVIQQSYTDSEVSVSFTVDPSDPNFDHVAIWFKGYHG